MSDSGLRKVIAKNAIQYHQPHKNGHIKFKLEWLDDYIAVNSVPVKILRLPTKSPFKLLA